MKERVFERWCDKAPRYFGGVGCTAVCLTIEFLCSAIVVGRVDLGLVGGFQEESPRRLCWYYRRETRIREAGSLRVIVWAIGVAVFNNLSLSLSLYIYI